MAGVVNLFACLRPRKKLFENVPAKCLHATCEIIYSRLTYKYNTYIIQLTPHWGFSVADYIKCYAYLPKLVIFTTMEIYFPNCVYPSPLQLPVGGNRSARRKPTTFGRVLTNFFHMSGALGSSNIEKVLAENRTRNLRGERRVL